MDYKESVMNPRDELLVVKDWIALGKTVGSPYIALCISEALESRARQLENGISLCERDGVEPEAYVPFIQSENSDYRLNKKAEKATKDMEKIVRTPY